MTNINTDLLYKNESYEIIGACLEVYNVMGSGFLESVYQKCLEREFALRNIPFEAQKRIALSYKGVPIEQDYFPDFVCYGHIIVEIKAEKGLIDINRAQILNYLNATSVPLGWLVNFGHHKTLERERFVLSGNSTRDEFSVILLR
ncbi:MAG: GxxExxY protein [Kiritimatiellae bacterium]|nr:GxxExxY protein [Kiritimatiellia bacterium]